MWHFYISLPKPKNLSPFFCSLSSISGGLSGTVGILELVSHNNSFCSHPQKCAHPLHMLYIFFHQTWGRQEKLGEHTPLHISIIISAFIFALFLIKAFVLTDDRPTATVDGQCSPCSRWCCWPLGCIHCWRCVSGGAGTTTEQRCDWSVHSREPVIMWWQRSSEWVTTIWVSTLTFVASSFSRSTRLSMSVES